MLDIKKQIVPASIAKNCTYGNNNKKLYVTVHQTGNTNKGADAQAHANLQSNGNTRNASWHYQVDDKQAIQSFEHEAQCWHAGDGRTGNGNLNSIAVEICINSDGNYAKSVENGAKLVKKILEDEGLSINDVKQHYDWSRKNCPAQIRAGKDGITWNDFINMIKEKTSTPNNTEKTSTSKPDKPKTNTKSISQMAQEIIDGKHGNGHDNRRKSLVINQAEYDKVRAEVNRKLGASTSKPKNTKTIVQLATEVIQGKHGNGHANRQKSLGVDNTTYQKVRAEVNKRL